MQALVADPDAVRRAPTCAALAARGFTVAEQGGELATLLTAAPTVDLIVLEVILDNTDAFEVLRSLARAGVDRPILVLTDRFSGYLAFVRSMAHGLGLPLIEARRRPRSEAEWQAVLDAAIAAVEERRPDRDQAPA
jgi:DNA-binding NtrC family response regulator